MSRRLIINSICKKIVNHNFFKDEKGFTTLTVVISLLISLSLIFSTAQVYQVNSASANIQSVADACAQTAESEVAEFMILVRVADSTILSLNLAGIMVTGLGVVTMCIPGTATISDALINLAYKIFDARNSFADKVATSLNSIQKSLPFISSVKAYQLAQANNGGVYQANYLSISILMPGEGIEISPGNIDDIKDTLNEVSKNSDDIKQAALEAEKAAQKANESKLVAFMADCGNDPNYCMYERAKNKAYMTGPENPLYKSVDTWSFDVALKRCKAYYPKRLEIEHPEGSSVDDQANSALRKVFYTYASNQMKSAYVYDSGDEFSANFPHLPKNTDEMKQTNMYTDVMFPISNGNCMHAYNSCPGCSNICSYGSIAQMETSHYEACPYCKFSASSLGKVAAASSSIDNGYEYHYAIVEKASKDYEEAKKNSAPYNSKVKDFANRIFNKIKNLISDLSNKRIYALPPGSYGNLVLTVNTNSSPASKGFESNFVTSNKVLGIRAAISASTLVEENSDEGKTLINSLMDNLKDNLPTLSGSVGIALDLWSKLLAVFSEGQDSLIDGIETSLNQLPLMSASGLGTWASKEISNVLRDLGLEPANLNSLKPVLINSFYVANEESKHDYSSTYGLAAKGFAVKYLTIRNKAIEISEQSNSILTGISDSHEFAKILNLDSLIYDGGIIEIAVIEPLGDLGPSIPINIKLPQFATDNMNNILSWIAGTLQSILGDLWGGKVWR